MIQLISPNLNIDFLGKSKPFIFLSTALAIGSIVLLFTKGLNYGIDFTGGAEVQVRAPQGWDIGKVRSELDGGGLKDPRVVQIGDAAGNEYLIRVQADAENLTHVSETVSKILTEKGGAGSFEIKRADVVGPAAGATLRSSAILSFLYAMICIVAYIAIRFDIRYAPGVVRALAIDVTTTVGIWVIMGWEFNLTVLASLLTIAGYSCNDTIVIYDRIRDYTKSHPDWSLEQAINRSTNLNLGRTILTTVCTLMVVVSLWLLGGPVLGDFALPMLIGFTVSIPSTLFVATPMIVFMEKRRLAQKAAFSSRMTAARGAGARR